MIRRNTTLYFLGSIEQGIIIGAVVAILVLAATCAAVLFLYIRRKKQHAVHVQAIRDAQRDIPGTSHT